MSLLTSRCQRISVRGEISRINCTRRESHRARAAITGRPTRPGFDFRSCRRSAATWLIADRLNRRINGRAQAGLAGQYRGERGLLHLDHGLTAQSGVVGCLAAADAEQPLGSHQVPCWT
jgi:hypothetical protein